MKKCFCLLLTLILILGGCGVPEQESFTDPVISDFSEKPGREVDYVHSHPIGTTVRYDLNGDGVGENITVKAMEYEAGNLAIDGATVEFWSATPTGYFTVLNPDASRNVLLVGVSDYGPSDDPRTVFYSYDGNRITEIGYINDIIGQNEYGYSGAICHGNGTVTAKRRWDVLGSWNTVGLYEVRETGVEDITEFYPFIDWDGNPSTWEVTAKVDIIMYEQNNFDSDMITVPAGTVMNMLGIQKGPSDSSFWVAFDVEARGQMWLITERIEWESFLHTGIGFVSSDEAFDGFYYAG